MEGINLANNIVTLRHNRKITQEQLADFLGVTKASVSKWETEQNMPDVVLLPKMASFFDVTIDELLGYKPQLTKEQIQKVYLDLCTDFATLEFEAVMKKSRNLVKEYYSCYPFLCQIVVLWLNHYTLSPKDGGREILEEALELCDHISTNCVDIGIGNDVLRLKSVLFLQLGKAKEVIELVEEIYNPCRTSIGGESILVQAYQVAGDREKADSYAQIFQYLQILSIVESTNQLISIHSDDFSYCEKAFERVQQVIEAYDLGTLNFNIVAVLSYQMAMICCIHGQYKKALALLKKITEYVVDWLCNEKPVLHGDDYFYQLDYWIEKQDLAGAAPRNKKFVYESLVSILETPSFEVLKEEKEFKEIKKIVERTGEREWKI